MNSIGKIGYLATVLLLIVAGSSLAANLTPKEKLGKNLFFDIRLSKPAGQACASCHSPGSGFNGLGDASIPIHEGAVEGRFGNRNPPSAAYASFSPPIFYDSQEGLWIGGQFWDGRAATLADQAKGPFLNPVEQNNTSKNEVVTKVIFSNYVDLFIQVYGLKALLNVNKSYNNIADAIAAYESSAEVNRFSSKYDLYLAGKIQLSPQEQHGLILFNDPAKGNCSACHPSVAGPYADKPLFTDFTYDNLGIPKLTTDAAVDLGLGAIVNNPMEYGKFKVPTLRNLGISPPYGHNGYFKTLKEIVHFYNTRDVAGENWAKPDYPNTMNVNELGNLGLSGEEEDAIVAFILTLTDGYVPPNPR